MGLERGMWVLQFIPLPPEGSGATSLLTGKPAPIPLFNTGPSDGCSCHVNPSKLIAAHRERNREGRECEDVGLRFMNCHTWKLIMPQKEASDLCLIYPFSGNQFI